MEYHDSQSARDEIFEVKWFLGAFELEDDNYNNDIFFGQESGIVGNTYENPELLN